MSRKDGRLYCSRRPILQCYHAKQWVITRDNMCCVSHPCGICKLGSLLVGEPASSPHDVLRVIVMALKQSWPPLVKQVKIRDLRSLTRLDGFTLSATIRTVRNLVVEHNRRVLQESIRP